MSVSDKPTLTRLDARFPSQSSSVAGKCELCNASPIVMSLHQHFGVQICWDCKKIRTEYNLITKTKAREEYLVPERELKSWKCIEKANPHRDGWQNMKLYLLQKVMGWSFAEYGGAHGLIREKANRAVRRYEQQQHLSLKRKQPQQYFGEDREQKDESLLCDGSVKFARVGDVVEGHRRKRNKKLSTK